MNSSITSCNRSIESRFVTRLGMCLALISTFFFLPSVNATGTLVQWQIGTGLSSAKGTTSGTATVTNGLSASVFTLEGGNSNTTSSGGWRLYNSVTNLTLATAISDTNYLEFSLTPSVGYTDTITGVGSGNFYGSANGPQDLALIWSTNSTFSSYTAISTNVTGYGTTQGSGTQYSSLDTLLSGNLSSSNLILSGGTQYYFGIVFYNAVQTTAGVIMSGANSSNTQTTNNFSFVGTVSGGVNNDIWSGGSSGNWSNSAGTWTVNGSSNGVFSTGDNATITNATTLTLGSSGVTAGTFTNSAASGLVELKGGQLSASSVVQSGSSTLVLDDASTISGATTVSAGKIILNNNNSLGSSAVTLNGGILGVTNASVTQIANLISVGNSSGGSIDASSGVSVQLSSAISATGTTSGGSIGASTTFSSLTLNPSGTGTISLTANVGAQMSAASGSVTSAGGVNLQIGGGTIIITNNPTLNLASGVTLSPSFNGMVWNGNVDLDGGTVQINGGNINGTGIIDVGGNGATGSSSTISSRLNFSSPTISNSITVETNNTLQINVPTGAGMTIAGPISGSGTITVGPNGGSQSGVVTISGSNSFSGTITDTNVLKVTGNLGSATVGVAGSSAILSGNGGTVGPTSFSGTSGNLIVGVGNTTSSAPGSLTFNGGLTLNGTTTTYMNLTNSASEGSDYSQLTVNNGTLTYAGTLDISVTTSNGFSLSPFMVDLISINDGLSGDFSTVNWIDNGTNNSLVDSAGTWRGNDGTNTISFTESTGVLAVDSVPEPSAFALMGVALTVLTLTIARRRRRS